MLLAGRAESQPRATRIGRYVITGRIGRGGMGMVYRGLDEAGAYFLKATATVDIRSAAESRLDAPALGRVSIKANPDNCEVFLDGTFVDYPPILDKPIVEGAHTVAFKWPDGLRREEAVHVGRGAVVYVTGRRD